MITKKSTFDGTTKELTLEEAIAELLSFSLGYTESQLRDYLSSGLSVYTEISVYQKHTAIY